MNKIKYGLKNVHYAKVLEHPDGTVTYMTPIPLPGAVTLALKANVEKTAIPADDDPEYAIIYDNKGYDGDLEVQVLPDDFRVTVLGEGTDSNGVQFESNCGVQSKIALLFEIAGDKNKVRHVMYNCSVTKPDIESSTRGDKIENKADKLTFTASPSKDGGHVKAKVDATNPKYDTWFDAVYVIGDSAAILVTPTEIVFDKKTANQKDLVFNLMLGGSQTLSSIKNNGSTLTATTHYTNATGVVTIKTAYLSTLGVGVAELVFSFSDGAQRTVLVNVINTTV